MRKKAITQLVLKISDGIFSSLLDLILLNIFYFTEVSLSGSPGKVGKASILAHRDFESFNSETIKRAIAQARSRGFIKEDFTLTKEGKERLERILPSYFGEKKWDGNWYLVVYDIPKSLNRYRDILRENLKRLGFGQLQASVWVSPFNFFGEVERVTKDYGLSPYVILAITNKLGKKEAKILAEKIWYLEEINNRYTALFSKFKKSKEKDLYFERSEKISPEAYFERSEKISPEAYFEYLSILDKDPQLPKELLPGDWKGEEVHSIFQKIKKIERDNKKRE